MFFFFKFKTFFYTLRKKSKLFLKEMGFNRDAFDLFLKREFVVSKQIMIILDDYVRVGAV